MGLGTLRIFSFVLTAIIFFGLALPAQETRGAISGRVLDPQAIPIPRVLVTITNTETSSRVQLTTNETGYFEARLLMPGTYDVSAEADGFKRATRLGLVLSTGAELQIEIALQLGAVTETVQVTAEAPVLETSAVAEAGLVTNKDLMDLPNLGNNPLLLAKLVPGIQTDGLNNYLGLHSIAGGSDYYTPGKVGGNEWSVDGVPNQGGGRRAAYLPHSDTVMEFRVESSGFDVSRGRGTGASINVISRSGTNQYHGTLTHSHWQQRYNGTPFFVRQLYYRNIAAAEAAGDQALANELRNTPKQPSGHSNIYSATFGGPVVIPKIYNGRNKLFSLFSFSGYTERKTEDANSITRTVPTMANRRGDFSDLLRVDPVRYQVYDPLTVRRDPDRATHWIRDPFPSNVIPAQRMQNPIYNTYVKFYPVPNNDPLDPRREPRQNYLAVATPYNWDYQAYNQRVDYQHSERHRFFGRWSYNSFLEDRSDWTYSTMRGLHTNGLRRKNIGATIDWTWVRGNRTIIDVAVAANEYRDGSERPVQQSFKPSDVGLPEYMDEIAGDNHIIPQIRVSGYTNIGPDGVPTFSAYRMYSGKADVSHVRGKHTFRAGADTRQHFRTGGGGGNTSGRFEFTNNYTRHHDDTAVATPGDLGLSWASFYLGIPNAMRISTSNETYAMHSPYFGGYAQDTLRLSPRLSVNFGFRLEYELGPSERYNRMVGEFDPNAKIAFAELVETVYAASPLAEKDPSQFRIRGGTAFPGVGGANRRLFRPEWMFMPRLAFAYQINPRTVLRGGYGTFFDTLNVLNNAPNQAGYSRETTTPIANNFGETWRAGDPVNGISPLRDPFPLRADGTRVLRPLLPARDGVESIAFVGRDMDDFWAYDTSHARLRRWRVSLQRQLGRTMVVEAAYAGSYGDRVYITKELNALPGEFWADGRVRQSQITTYLNGNVPNPFRITNFPQLQASNPVVYEELSAQSYFTNTSVQRQRLLRPYPHMGADVTQRYSPFGKVRTASLELTFQRRFSKGLSLTAGYTRLRNKSADWYANEFDTDPSWRLSNNGRPHRLTATGVYQLPFGKRRAFLKRGALSRIFGGFQVAATYELQPGALLDFGNIFYYGDLNSLETALREEDRTLDRWFNSSDVRAWFAENRPGTNACQTTPVRLARADGMGFETCSAYGPDTYHRRVFPSRVEGIRADITNQWNLNLQREIGLTEKVKMFVRVDALNLQNRSRFNAPSVDPTSTNFGRVTTQSSALNRFFQLQGRITF